MKEHLTLIQKLLHIFEVIVFNIFAQNFSNAIHVRNTLFYRSKKINFSKYQNFLHAANHSAQFNSS